MERLLIRNLDIPAEFLAEDAQSQVTLIKEQATARCYTTTGRGIGSGRLATFLGADVNAGNIIEPRLAVKERKNAALVDLQYRASRLYHTMKDVKAMNQKQLVEEYEYICRRLEKDRLLSAHSKYSAGFHPRRDMGVSPFADSAASSSPSNVSIDHIPLDFLSEIHDHGVFLIFFTESDEEEQIGMSRIAADPDSDDDVFAEIIFRGKSISSDGVVFVDKLPDDEIVDPRVKVETITESLPQLLLGLVENRRRKCFTYLKELLPHVYREDLLLLRRRMNRYFRLNPDVNVGLDLWRDVNMLCQSLHSDDVEDFWRTQDDWIVSSWKLYPKSSVHVQDLTNGKTVLTVPPLYCRDVFVAGNVIQTVQTGLRQAYKCLASAPIACTARQMVFSSPWLTATKESGSPLQTLMNEKFGAQSLSKRLQVTLSLLGILFLSDVYSILLLREDLSRNLELTESTPSLGEDCWELLKTTKCRFCYVLEMFVSADGIKSSS
ncbi:hypothetical protein Tco_0129419 [Tanacetum coccineum]